MRRFVVYFDRRSSPSDRVHALGLDIIRGWEENLEPKTTIVSGAQVEAVVAIAVVAKSIALKEYA